MKTAKVNVQDNDAVTSHVSDTTKLGAVKDSSIWIL